MRLLARYRWPFRGDSFGDISDEGLLADFVAGVVWFSTGLIALLLLAFVPNAPDEHRPWLLACATFGIVFGLISLHMALSWTRPMPIAVRALVTAAWMPVIGVAIWASGGATSYAGPGVVFTTIYIAYFLPPRFAWPLIALFLLTFATPLFYDDRALDLRYPARVVTYAIGVVGTAMAMQFLKRRLVRAEARQREMAERDPLTGLYNRRAFDAVLPQATRASAASLVLFDFDGFKAINDVHGHPVGDEVLQTVAQACRAVVREDDCLARIGGDEFAVIAPGAGAAGVTRMVAALDAAISTAPTPRGVAPVRATFAWAVAPDDAQEPAELLRCADQRLLLRKQDTRRDALARPTR